MRDGCRGAFVVPFTWSRLPHGHPDHDPLFAAAQALGVPLALHPAFEPPAIASTRFTLMRKTRLLASVTAADGVRHAFTTLFDFGVFDRFPQLKVVVLESGAGWIGYWLDRLDAVYGATFIGERVPLAEKPSHYFKTRCWISSDPDERTIPALVDLLGADRFFWASDYPHADHTASYMREVEELAGLLDEPEPQALPGRERARALPGLTSLGCASLRAPAALASRARRRLRAGPSRSVASSAPGPARTRAGASRPRTSSTDSRLGSQVRSTSACATPGIWRTFCSTSGGRLSATGHIGEVSVMRTFTWFSSSISMPYTSPSS